MLAKALLFVAALNAAFAAHAETFKYGSFVPERSSGNARGVFPTMEKIEKATGGRVKFERLVGGTVLTAPNSLRGIREKVVDAGFIVAQFHVAEIPHASLLAELTGLGTETYATAAALNEVYFVTCSACREDFRKQGVVPLFIQGATPLTMACTRDAAKAADLKGLRLSAIGTPEMRWGALLGMTVRRQTFAELVQALQLGQSDCVTAPLAWIKSYGLTDVVKSVIDMPQGVITGAVPFLFNAESWSRISEADRRTILRMVPGIVHDFTLHAYEEDDALVRKELSRVAFHPGDAALAGRWREYQAKEISSLAELAERRRLPEAKELAQAIAAVYRKWHVERLPKFKGNREAYVKMLESEVFSKVPR